MHNRILISDGVLVSESKMVISGLDSIVEKRLNYSIFLLNFWLIIHVGFDFCG